MRFSTNAIKWVHSYISGRTQAVVCNEEVSEFLPVTSGVPQSSSPGPIFFSILINSLPHVSSTAKSLIFSLLTIYNFLFSVQLTLYRLHSLI